MAESSTVLGAQYFAIGHGHCHCLDAFGKNLGPFWGGLKSCISIDFIDFQEISKDFKRFQLDFTWISNKCYFNLQFSRISRISEISNISGPP